MKKSLTNIEYSRSKYNEFKVKKNQTIFEFILEQMSGVSKNHAKDLLKGKAVSVNQQIVTHFDFLLTPGMSVRIAKHKRSTELKNQYVKIVYEDKDLIVIEKNVGILSMASTTKQYCVKDVLDSYFDKRHFNCHAHVVHRLDRETSGLMIYAKSIEAAQILESDWHRFVFDRRYVAVLSGEMPQEGGTVHNWLKDNKMYVTYASDADNGGKEAVTHYRRIQSSNGFTLAEMKLDTGRKNQIRVHMADLGFPIVGDMKYGNGRNPIGRMCLHAYRLCFYHPITNVMMKFETPFPTPFLRLLKHCDDIVETEHSITLN